MYLQQVEDQTTAPAQLCGGIIQPVDADALPAEGAETSTPTRKETNWTTVPVKLLFWCETEEVFIFETIFENALPVQSCAASGLQHHALRVRRGARGFPNQRQQLHQLVAL